MAFKQTRPFRMNKPAKSGLNLGRKTTDSGLYYNSKMGPMQMHSPSALKQMEEGGAGMEEMMGMMGDMSSAPAEGPVEEAPVQKEGGEETANSISGQEIVVEEDGTMIMTDEYGVAGVPEGAEVKDPNGVLEINDGYVADNDYTFEVEGNTVIITGIAGE